MKKLVFATIACFIALTCSAQTLSISLNGYLKQDALNMIKPYQVLSSQTPQLTSVWIDKNILTNIIALLNKECDDRRTEHRPLTDGIRIYFAYDNFNQATIVIVSTYDSGVKNPQSPEKAHYHEHAPDAALFNMKNADGTKHSINGEVCHDHSCDGGARLYTISHIPDDPACDSSNPHYLARAKCEAMAQNFDRKLIKVNSEGEWFDLKMISAFADEIKKKPLFDGIRIYFATHSSHDGTPYAGRDCFVIVTTQIDPKDASLIRQDYFDCSTLSSYFKKLKKSRTPLIDGQDNGQLCPYNCN